MSEGIWTLDKIDLENTSYDYYNNSCGDCSSPCNIYTIQAFEKVFLPIFYILIFLLGLWGNIMVLVVLLRAKESLPGTDVFIFNLALADILLVVTLPFWVTQAVHGWIFQGFLCKVVGGIFKINFYASIFFLICISIDRYLSIVCVIRMYNRRKSSLVLLASLAVWVLCILLTVPNFIFLNTEYHSRQNLTSCSLIFVLHSAKVWKIGLSIFNQVVAFFLPLVAMGFCYICVILTLLHSKGFQKHKALKVIFAVVAVFFLCWTPYYLVQFVGILIDLKVLEEDCERESQLAIAEAITTSLGFLHCCLNPILYAFVGIKFWNRFLELLQHMGCVSQEFLKRHSRLLSHRRDSTWSESTEASYTGL
ncbi:C-X-C chemokine receptor type 3-like [Tiliqua scincoides]|uniref:C-X-C chemokine receptor type 3-like n=1 Tax=Tiliqua scincoides TaxID=71010 RepID=UPI0034638480